MLLFASFGDAVNNPDPWQYILGALIPMVAVWLSGRFPVLATILKMLNINVQPVPVPAPVPPPVDPAPVPVPAVPSTITDLIMRLLELLKQKKSENAEVEAAVKALAAVVEPVK